MKFLLILSLSLLTYPTLAQTIPHDTLSFCSIRLAAPQGCLANSEYQIECDHYSVGWIYLTEDMLETVPEQFVAQLGQQFKDFKKEPVSCLLLDTESKGYRLKFRTKDGELVYQLIAFGVPNEQPVIVQLTMDKEPLTNGDIPEWANQIISLDH